MPHVLPEPYWHTPTAYIYQGDCLYILPQLPSRSVDLVFADPPFNVGYDYDIYQDKKTKQEYLEWTGQWLKAVRRLMKPTGSIYVAIGIGLQAEVKIAMDKAGYIWRDTICWHYTFGPRQHTRFTPSWVAIHYATMSDIYTWNPEPIKVPSARQIRYKDKRADPNEKVPNNVWVLDISQERGCWQPWHNSWKFSRVCGTFKERTNHPCQMPQTLLERIIQVSSDKGDIVLDPFAGSHTTLAAALTLGRKAWGIELSETYIRDCGIPRLK